MKKSIALLLVIALILCLGACGQQQNSVSTPSDATSNSDAQNSESVKSDVKLTYWSMWNETEPQALVISDAVKDFKEQTGIEVEIVFNGRDTKKTLQPAIDAGTQIDVFDYDLEWLHENWGDYTLVIEDYIKKDYLNTDGKPLEDCLNSLMLSLARTVGPDGQLDCVPYQPCSTLVMYNKTLFQQAGIDSAPKTWEEFLDVCAKLKEAGIVPLTVDDAYMALPFGAYLARLIGQDGIDKLVADKTWDTPKYVRPPLHGKNSMISAMFLKRPPLISSLPVNRKLPAAKSQCTLMAPSCRMR